MKKGERETEKGEKSSKKEGSEKREWFKKNYYYHGDEKYDQEQAILTISTHFWMILNQ